MTAPGSLDDAILKLEGVSVGAAGATLSRSLDLTLPPGGLLLVDAGGPDTEQAIVDAALGLRAPLSGMVRLLGHDWSQVPWWFATALRGRVGLIPRRGGWLDHLPTAANVVLRPHYHLRTSTAELVTRGERLAARFFLPGLPLDPVRAMHPRDRLRAACVRGLLGEPILVIIETPFETGWGTLVEPLVASFQEVRERGGAVVWFLTDDPLFADTTLPADQRLRLRERRRTAETADA